MHVARCTLHVTPFLIAASLSAQIPSPEQHLGFRPGADSMLADWSQITGYLTALANASPVVRLDTIGRTNLGKPLLMVTFATAANQARLDALRARQARLADPRTLSHAAEDSLVRHGPAVVLINNNIHATEIASSQMQLEMAHRFASDPVWRGWLDSLVVLMIPSVNPDGLDTVVAWYRYHQGTRYEGGSLPWLYQPYTGHDTPRDWYMLTQPESRAVTRVLYQEWFPAVVWDLHQMGNRGARLFVPPFADPVNPNLDPILVEGINLVGTAMAGAVLDAGLTGVVHQQQFDLWWHGGFRSVPSRHNMIGILSEAASARLASPIQQDPADLRQPARGVNYPAPWIGGWWRMGDIVAYELHAAEGLLRLVATQRGQFVRRFVTLGRRAIADTTGPSVWLIPSAQRDPEAWYTLADLLIRAGIDVRQRPNGDLVIPGRQPFRAHVKDLLEVQAYPDSREPYDIAGWTLGLQMGVEVRELRDRTTVPDARLAAAPRPGGGGIAGSGRYLRLPYTSNAETRMVVSALRVGARVWADRDVVIDANDRRVRAAVDSLARHWGIQLTSSSAPPAPPPSSLNGLPRIGLYQPWTGSMDEGWTRWVLEQYGVPYVTLHDADLRTGRLNGRIDVLILPDEGDQSITQGRDTTQIPARFSGGIGTAGEAAVVQFVRGGGTLIALDASSDFAIRALNLPAVNVLADSLNPDRGSRFSASGSIFGTALEAMGPWTAGMGDSVAVFFANGRAWDVASPGRVVARYATNPLRSGYVNAPERIAGKAAMVVVPVDRGRAVLFGFRPQHRGQPHATFKLLFNAALFGGMSR